MGEQAAISFDLFISYAEADSAWVHGYLLPALGLPEKRAITRHSFWPGAPLVDEFERAVTASRYTLLILSAAYLADEWSLLGEHLASYLTIEQQPERLIPLRLQPCEVPLRISFRVGLDCTAEARWESEMARLRRLLDQPEPVLETPKCPYPGMVPFRADDARFFFGREKEIDDMLQRLRHQHFLVVIGDSGSGKSSLINAGLLPRLAESTLFPPGCWLVRTMSPGSQPLQTLAQRLGADLAEPALAVANLLAANPPAQRLLLVIDQFEELFTQASPQDKTDFIRVLQAMRAIESCALVLALRGDFFYTDLKSTDLWPETFSERLEIDPLRGEALRDAIEKPAAREGVYLEPVLVERLIADAAEERGALPLVQETMFQLWDKMEQRFISLDAYRRLGGGERSGLAGALVTFANTTLDALVGRSPQHETIAHRIFLRLVQFGEGRADTRRQQPKAALCSWDDTAEVFDETLQYLAENRLLTLSGEEEDKDSRVDIAHETLFTEWPALKELVRKYRKDEQMRRRLEESATNWIKRKRDPREFLNAGQLKEAQDWMEGPEAGELGYSKGLRELVRDSADALRRTRLFRLVAWAAILGSIVVALVIALWSSQRIAGQEREATDAQATLAAKAHAGRDDAVRAKETADAERLRADSLARDIHLRQLLVQSQSLLADRDQALLLSIAAYRQADTDETRDNLLRVLRARPQLIRYIPVSDTPTAMAFSPDGGTLVTLTQDGIQLWDAGTGVAISPVSQVIGGSHVVTRDGKTGFSSQGSTIQSWDLTSRLEPHFLSGLQTDEISPDGRVRASWGKGGVVLQDVATGKLIGTLGDPELEYGYNLTFNPNGEQLVAASDGPGELIIYEVIFTWDLKGRLEEYRESPEQYPDGFWVDEADREYIPVDDSLYRADVTNFVFSPDGRNLAANVAKHVDVAYWLGGEPSELWRGEAALTSLASFCGGTVATGSEDGQIEGLASVVHHPGPVDGLVLSADCNRMASVGGGVLTLWDLSATGSALALQPISTPIATLAAAENALFSGWDYSGAVSGSECTRQASQHFEDSPCVQSSIPGDYAGFTGITTSLEESPDGKTVAAGICSKYEFYLEDSGYHPESCAASEVWVWLGGPTEGMKLGETQGVAVTELIFSPDGKALAAIYQDGSIMIWDVDIESLIAEACYKVGRNLTDTEWTALTGYDRPDRPGCPSTERPDPNRWAATLKQLEPLLAAPRPTITPWPTRTSRPTWTPRLTVTPRLTKKPTPTMTPRRRPGDGG